MSAPSLPALEQRLADLRAKDPGIDPNHDGELARTLAAIAWEIAIGDFRTAEAMATEAIERAAPLGETAVEALAHNTLAFVHRGMGAMALALKHAEAARLRFEAIHNPEGVARALVILSSIQEHLGDFSRALESAHRGVEAARRSQDPATMAWAMHALATVQSSIGNFESALAGLDEARTIFLTIGNTNGVARCLSSLGYANLDLGHHQQARTSFLESRAIYEAVGSLRGLAATERNLAELALQDGHDLAPDPAEALARAEACLEASRKGEISDLEIDGLLLTARAQLALGDMATATQAAEESRKMATEQQRGQAEIRALEVLATIAARRGDHEGAYELLLKYLARDRAYQEEQKPVRKRELELGQRAAEAEATDRLLHTVLPAPVVQELKLRGVVRPRRFEDATVLFTDLVGFTDVASRMAPEALVEELERLFGAFDEIIRQHGLERLKTIGDAYMAVAGVPLTDPVHVQRSILAALGFRQAVARLATEASLRGQGPVWQLRIGLHTGPVVAGMIGRDRTAYDIWGDTVNVASRMESNGAPGRINISEAVHRAIAPWFLCEPRGSLAIKNRGHMDMWFVERLRPEWSADEEGLVPCDAFWDAVRNEA
ncbi:MAG: adenylate/guanylate cyclase domain-containing protein [Candidatus Sericytochromatia bacterium]|nr:adenylate/guanylate cyclase domain-containing protein [Candidatus Sericytochromatia bacterium]